MPTHMAISKMETTTQKGRERMTAKELSDILKKHEKWIEGKEGGERADLRCANLRDAKLKDANLRGANLRDAKLRETNLRGANLRYADLRYADLAGANLRDADLRYADLRHTDLSGADLDYSSWPLWCGSFDVKVNKRIVAQLAYHFCRLDCDDPEYQEAKKTLSRLANQFHRVGECGRIEDHA